MAKKRGPKVRATFVHLNGERVIVCNLTKFARERGLNPESIKEVHTARRIANKGWFCTKHPRFKEVYANETRKIINLNTKEIVSLNGRIDLCAKKINVAYRKLMGLKHGERTSCKEWVLLDTYNQIYSNGNASQ